MLRGLIQSAPRLKRLHTCLLPACTAEAGGRKRWESTEAAESKRSLFCVNVEGKRNISPILLGLFDHFLLMGPSVGYFQPIAGEPFPGSSSKVPRHVELIRSGFSLEDDPAAMIGVSRRECVDMLAQGKEDELLDVIFTRYEAYRSHKDIVLVEGTHSDGPIYVPGTRLELNAKVAATLASPILMTLDAKVDEPSDLASRALICKNTFEQSHARVLGLVLNQVKGDRLDSLPDEVKAMLDSKGLPVFGALPHSAVLGSIRLDEIQTALGADLLRRHSRLDVGVDQVILASGGLDKTLGELGAVRSERALVACDASRTDLLLGLSAAHGSRAGPHMAAVLMTGGVKLNRQVESILEGGGLEGSTLPLLATEKSAWEAAQQVSAITPDILPSSARKIEEAKALVSKFVDFGALHAALETQLQAVSVTPKLFMHNINRTCEQQPQHIVLPEGAEPRVLRAAAEVTRKGLARITLLGELAAIRAEAARISVDISQCNITDHHTSEKLEQYAQLLVEKRKQKGMTLDRARDLLQDPNYFGTLMAASDDADGMVSGSTTTTANTIRPALQVLKTKESLVSSVFFMCLPTKVLVYGDCAVNVDPNPQELAKIGITSADTAAAFGIEPRVAFLSYSTMGSGAGPDVEKVTKAVEIAKQMRPDLMLDGPIQYDAAVDPEVARTKVKGQSQVAGRATVLIVPDLNTGNIVYKAVQQSTGAIAIGPVLQGLTKPVNDLSRGCTVPDIINTITCTEVQAVAIKQRSGQSTAAAAA